ncbi:MULTISPECIES: ammonium transporter [Rhodococcus]|uniref:ammonium transporter n=1 Tax=Rhodococcus TaxID=1827 RepID=UPI001E50A883|nr:MULTISPECIES: ammonium transporter [Rhodococcus]MCD2104154.1 ammonium transporter [Rhodococcus qingshengii]MCZ4523207.1 ammonium transporter [Rhodococcus erythropolis]MDV8007184.1 ammonium transporter [Rhodococcus sp. IEGM 1318]
MLMAASLVLLMTPGLAFFYGGMSRSKSVLNMMMMSFGAMAVIGVIYVLWGWSMSYGTENIGGIFANPFEFFGLKNSITDADGNFIAGAWGYPKVIDIAFQVTFAIITTALISGALAERVKFGTWLLFSGIWVTVVYFPLAHMVWGGGLLSGSEDGIAAKLFGTTVNDDGVTVANVAPIDFAGGTVVHINAGMAGLVLALIVGKRLGFGKTAFRPHNLPFVMLGAALLWFGWFGFNAGSAFAADGNAGLAWVNTTTATCAAVLAWLATERIRDGHATSLGAASGAVAGLVAITPAAGALNPVGSIFLGAVAGILSALAVGLKFRFGFDDSLDVVGVHLVSGLWGTIGIGFFGTATGLFYGGDYKQLVVQIVIALAALVFTGVLTTIIGFALKPLGWRISAEDEARGIDETEHAETAYDLA